MVEYGQVWHIERTVSRIIYYDMILIISRNTPIDLSAHDA